MDCPDCSSGHTEVLESRLCNNGTRRRRHRCLTCDHRWTTWDGPKPTQGNTTRRTTANRGKRLDPEEVRHVLLSPREVSNAQLSRELGVSAEMIRQIRIGKAHAKVHPEIARWGAPPPETAGRTCYTCSHWREARGCSFGFPDPTLEGVGFARECDLYQAA